jgi:hypothetical protein
MENHSGIVVEAELTQAIGRAERAAPEAMIVRHRRARGASRSVPTRAMTAGSSVIRGVIGALAAQANSSAYARAQLFGRARQTRPRQARVEPS